MERELRLELAEAKANLERADETVVELAQINTIQEHLLIKLLRVYDLANSGTALVSNQGQALDGYSELAEYRALLKEIKAFLEG